MIGLSHKTHAFACRMNAVFLANRFPIFVTLCLSISLSTECLAESPESIRFFEQKIRPLLVDHCYECHSERAGERQGGLLLDRKSGWLEGGNTNKAVVPGDPNSSQLMHAIRYRDRDLQMPPGGRLSDAAIALFEKWIILGAPGPAREIGPSDFSTMGNQKLLFQQAADHWAFQPIKSVSIPDLQIDNQGSPNDPKHESTSTRWEKNPIDRFVRQSLLEEDLAPSARADTATLLKRLHYDLTGLPPSYERVCEINSLGRDATDKAISRLIHELIDSPAFGEHFGRLWLDVVRYGDTDNNYRPDTRTPKYFPFAFSYRDYVVNSLNADKPYDQFLKEQIAADLMGYSADAPELAALGFYAAGPFATRAQAEALDDWIDVTTRGLMGMTVACARCHDHKFEPVPTTDYYSLRGVFAAVSRVDALDETNQPILSTYSPTESQVKDYETKRAKIEAKIDGGKEKKGKGSNRTLTQKIRETELAHLMLFHPGAPARAMMISERKTPPPAYVFRRGDATLQGELVPRRFLRILDPEQTEFSAENSGRLQLAEQIASPSNPLTARVLVNRIWGHLIGSHLVATTSDFGLQGSPPTHPELLDWLTLDFVQHGWSIKHLVHQIVSSQTYQQTSQSRLAAAERDPENLHLWRANRKHLSIEALRDSVLFSSNELDCRMGGHAEELWKGNYSRRRAIYGFVNRFNLDPTLRAFDFPNPVQTQPARRESIVAFQALFKMNSPFVIDQAAKIASTETFRKFKTDRARTEHLFQRILTRDPSPEELSQTINLIRRHDQLAASNSNPNLSNVTGWALTAQALLMSNEFQYVD